MLTPLYTSPTLLSKLKLARRLSPACLQIITDFDHTLSAPPSDQCHDVVAKLRSMPDSFRDDTAHMLDWSKDSPRWTMAGPTLEDWCVSCFILVGIFLGIR